MIFSLVTTAIHSKDRTSGGIKSAVSAALTAEVAAGAKTAAAASAARSRRAGRKRSSPGEGSARGAWDRGGVTVSEIRVGGTAGARARGRGSGKVWVRITYRGREKKTMW